MPKTNTPTTGQVMCQQVLSILERRAQTMKGLDEGDNTQWAAGQLLLAADRNGMLPKDVALFPHILKKYGLRPGDITPEVLRITTVEDRRYSDNIVGAVTIINRMGSLAVLQRKFEASGFETMDEFMGSDKPAKPSVDSKTVGRVVPGKVPICAEPRTQRSKVFGHTVTAVLRWMGTEGFDPKTASRALDCYGVRVSPVTVAIQLKAGKSGEKPPAELTDEQANEIYEKISK